MKDNSGSLSKNAKKEKPSQPDLKGKALIGGVEYWISAWTKTGDDGKWLSLAFEPRQVQQAGVPVPVARRMPDDDISW